MGVNNNPLSLKRELNWLEQVLDARLALYFGGKSPVANIEKINPPAIDPAEGPYAAFLAQHRLNFSERLILILAITPHLMPALLDRFFIRNSATERPYSEFGGLSGHSAFLPTGETACFILAADDVARRIETATLFSPQHLFRREGILRLDNPAEQNTPMSGALQLSTEYQHTLLSSQAYEPAFSTRFPAKKLDTSLDWEDLVLEQPIIDEIDMMLSWVQHQEQLKAYPALHRRAMKGYRALFYGPPGTGKSLSVNLIGKTAGRPVYRIDLSQLVSKYIGETEKNLSSLFDQAEHKRWILFFDEADALFGKRTEVSDAKDKFANQETAYLLQRIEDYHGLIILATNLKPNIDLAFIRRFQSIIYFQAPGPEQRLILWQKALQGIPCTAETDLQQLALNYELSGGAINNIIQFAWLNTRREGRTHIDQQDLSRGIRREYYKESKTFPQI
jgi:hypothetical protein